MSKRKKSFDEHPSRIRSENIFTPALPLNVSAGIAAIAVAVFLAYIPAINGRILLDDDYLLTNNTYICGSHGLYKFWCTTEAMDYWPLTNTTFWTEWRLWELNPAGYHVTNLILHIVEALLIWLILRKLSIPGAFWAAMIFALHPVNVESTAWIAQRKNLMAMLFFLLSILWYLKMEIPSLQTSGRHAGSLSPLSYCLSLGAFILAMLSKGSVAVLPVLLLGIVWWLRSVGTVPTFAGVSPACSAKIGLSPYIRGDLLRTAPFFLVALALTGVNVWFQTHGMDVAYRSVSFTDRLLGAGGVVWFYLYKALVPLNLVFVYSQWRVEAGNPLWWLPLAAALALTALLWQYRKGWSRPLLFAWGFFCVTLTPVLGLKDVGFMEHSLVADHYQHIAIIGVIALVSAGFSAWHRQAGNKSHRATTVAVVAVGILAFLTLRQSSLYHDAITLYQATLEKNPESWLVQNNLGIALDHAGRPQDAIESFREALRLKPNYPEAHYNQGFSLAKLGLLPQAIEEYKQALILKSDYSEAHNNLGIALSQQGLLPEAIDHFEQSLKLNPDYPQVHDNLGAALLHTDRRQEAIEHFHRALRLKPDDPEAYYYLGNVSLEEGRLPEAIDYFQKALSFKPDYPEAHVNLGIALARSDRPREAIEHYQESIDLTPDSSDAQFRAYYNMASAYAKMHQSAQFLAAAQKALELARSQGQTALARQIEDWLNSSDPYSTRVPRQ